MLDKFDTFIVGLVNRLDPQTAKIPQHADGHGVLRSGVDLLRAIRRPVVEAHDDAIRIRFNANAEEFHTIWKAPLASSLATLGHRYV